MDPEDSKPGRNEVANKVRDELEERRLFREHYDVYVVRVVVNSGVGMESSCGGFQSYATVVSLRVGVSWKQGALAADQVNDLQDHLDAHWLGRGGQSTLDHEECKITINGEYTWDSWTKEW